MNNEELKSLIITHYQDARNTIFNSNLRCRDEGIIRDRKMVLMGMEEIVNIVKGNK